MIETIKTVCSFLGVLYFPVIALSVWTQFRNTRLKHSLRRHLILQSEMQKRIRILEHDRDRQAKEEVLYRDEEFPTEDRQAKAVSPEEDTHTKKLPKRWYRIATLYNDLVTLMKTAAQRPKIKEEEDR